MSRFVFGATVIILQYGDYYMQEGTVTGVTLWLPNIITVRIGDIHRQFKPIHLQLKPQHMTNKPFDLERAKKGDKVIFRCGHIPRIICFDRVGIQSIVTLSLDVDIEIARYHHPDGSYYGEGQSSPYDLLMAPIEKTGWINLYQSKFILGVNAITSNVYESEVGALLNVSRNANDILICTQQITWTE